MALLGHPIAILDIDNAEAFCQTEINKTRIKYSADEREELLAEGLAILYELAHRYTPLPVPPAAVLKAWAKLTPGDRLVAVARYEASVAGDGRKHGSFSGHAAMFLGRRLGDSWHKWHPEHRYITDLETGKRGWFYTKPMLSLDNEMQRNSDKRRGEDRLMLNAKGITDFCHATASKLGVLGRIAASATAGL